MWRAVDDAMTALAGIEQRRVILVLSDGKDTGPRKFNERFITQLDIVDRARRDEIMIYGIACAAAARCRWAQAWTSRR